jgi:hypothetical protein
VKVLTEYWGRRLGHDCPVESSHGERRKSSNAARGGSRGTWRSGRDGFHTFGHLKFLPSGDSSGLLAGARNLLKWIAHLGR